MSLTGENKAEAIENKVMEELGLETVLIMNQVGLQKSRSLCRATINSYRAVTL
jgi:hypothetical protein